MFVVDRFDITPGWSDRTLLINNINKHHEVIEKSKILHSPPLGLLLSRVVGLFKLHSFTMEVLIG